MKQTKLTMNVSVQHREPGPLSSDEKKQLADFFIAIMNLASQKKASEKITMPKNK